MAKAAFWPITDAEGRKRGERTGLDTLVVHAVNDEYLVSGDSTPSVPVSYTHLTLPTMFEV